MDLRKHAPGGFLAPSEQPARSAVAGAGPAGGLLKPMEGTSRRVLIVDENRDAADLLAEGLRQVGHAVEVAYDGPRGPPPAAPFEPGGAGPDIGPAGQGG